MVFINAATQISLQQPLTESWLTESELHEGEPFVRSTDPDFRQWLSPLQSRRLGKMMKRSLVTAMKAMDDSGISQPDAIITGTGLGCIENTELFLEQLCREGEEMLKPTHFMQSTHNTISSLIAIHCKCHGYNSTYSHGTLSFDSALLDAFVQMRLGDISTALVTGNDEMTPSYFNILKKSGFLGQAGQVVAAEASVAMMLTTNAAGALCQLQETGMGSSIPEELSRQADAVLLGYNGCRNNDEPYDRLVKDLLSDIPTLRYKHIFGECYSASALGIYAAAHIVNRGMAPSFMRCDGNDDPLEVKRLLVLNHGEGDKFGYTLLTQSA